MKCDTRHIHGKKLNERAASQSASICGQTKSGRRRASRPALFFFILYSLYQECSITGASPRAYCVFHLHQHIFKLFSLLTRRRCDLQTRRAHFGKRAGDKQKCRACTAAAAAAARIVLYTYVCMRKDLDCAPTDGRTDGRAGCSGAFIYPKHASDNGALLFHCDDLNVSNASRSGNRRAASPCSSPRKVSSAAIRASMDAPRFAKDTICSVKMGCVFSRAIVETVFCLLCATPRSKARAELMKILQITNLRKRAYRVLLSEHATDWINSSFQFNFPFKE